MPCHLATTYCRYDRHNIPTPATPDTFTENKTKDKERKKRERKKRGKKEEKKEKKKRKTNTPKHITISQGRPKTADVDLPAQAHFLSQMCPHKMMLVQ